MPGQHADHVPALPGAEADQADVPGGRTFELGAQVPLHEFPPPREQGARIVVVPMPFHPVTPSHSATLQSTAALKAAPSAAWSWVSIRLSMGPGLVRNFTDRGWRSGRPASCQSAQAETSPNSGHALRCRGPDGRFRVNASEVPRRGRGAVSGTGAGRARCPAGRVHRRGAHPRWHPQPARDCVRGLRCASLGRNELRQPGGPPPAPNLSADGRYTPRRPGHRTGSLCAAKPDTAEAVSA
jgi:hypothetical protein